MFRTPQACLEAGEDYPQHGLTVGFDVGKRFHVAFARGAGGSKVLAMRVESLEACVDAFVARALEAAGCEPAGCLVVVDQRRNIGTVAVRRALAAGCDVAYITGKREKRARELFPGGVAKNDAKDAEAVAAAAAGMPQALLPVPDEADGLEGARRLRSRLSFAVKQPARCKNRVRAALVESNTAFERLVDLSKAWRLDVLERIGGPWQVLGAGKKRLAKVARGATLARSSTRCGRASRRPPGPPTSRSARRPRYSRCSPGGSAPLRPTPRRSRTWSPPRSRATKPTGACSRCRASARRPPPSSSRASKRPRSPATTSWRATAASRPRTRSPARP